MGNSFAGDSAAAGRRSELFFWCFAVVALFLLLGYNALWTSEGRWAEMAREMTLTGDWLHPSVNWRLYPEKPYLTSWLVLPFALLFGGVDELVVRIPSALAGLAGLYGTLLLGKTLFDRRTALMAGWMLLSCYGFLFWSRNVAAPADIAGLATTILAVAFFCRTEERGGFLHFFGFYLFCFLGVLAGGVPALLMPFAVLAPHLAARGRWKRCLRLPALLAFLLTAGACFALFYAAAVIPPVPSLESAGGGGSALERIWSENFVRFAGEFYRGGPVYTYLYQLPRGLLPWFPLIAVAIAGLVRNWKSLPDLIRELMGGSLLLFVLVMFLSPCRWYSMLPLLPFCALLGAVGMTGSLGVERWNRVAWQLMHFLVISAASLAVASLVAIPLWYRFVPFKPPLLLLISLPAAGVLTLCVMMFDSRSGGTLERLTGMPFRIGAPLLGGAILVVALFDCVLPSFTIYRSGKTFYRAFQKSGAGVSPERFFCWGEGVPEKLLFYQEFSAPVDDSEREIRREAGVPREEAIYRSRLARLSAFLARNAGERVAVMTCGRREAVESFSRAVQELKLPVDGKEPDFPESVHKALKQEQDDRCRNIWVFTVPGKTEEQQ